MRGYMLVLCLAVFHSASTEKKIVCYFGSWAVYRPGLGQFDINYINPLLCTHLIYTFVGLNGTEVTSLDPYQDLPDNWGRDGFGRFNALRKINPAIKTLVAIGGWNEGSENYSKMASTAPGREAFVDSAAKFVKKWNFDGFDLDWEYPAQRGGNLRDVDNYIELLKIMKSRFDKEGLLLTAAVAAPQISASQSYRIREMTEYLDFINLMAYDFHGSWESQTGINAPLYPSAKDIGSVRGSNVDASVKYWLSQGASKEKLIVGVPSYGRSFTLSNSTLHGIGAPVLGPGELGPYTRETGMLGYNEICEQNKSGGWTTVYDTEARVPYTFKDDQWVGFDDVRSSKEKAEYVKELDLGGAMIWSIETDDFRGICDMAYPILKALNEVLRDERSVSDETASPSATTQASSAKATLETSTDTTVTCNEPSICPLPSSQSQSTANLILCIFLISVLFILMIK